MAILHNHVLKAKTKGKLLHSILGKNESDKLNHSLSAQQAIATSVEFIV